MQDLAHALSRMLKTTVADETGLKPSYDFTLTDAGTLAGPRLSPDTAALPQAEPLPDIFSALQSQLGLKLKAKKVDVQVLTVDHIDKMPVEN